MKEDLISVIVPVYNVEEYLDRCIESIVTQTYTNLEIILIDDGSTDGSARKCDEWSQKDGRIIVIHKENGGVSSARNKGLEIASGKYIGFVDSDDYVRKNMYEVLLNKIKDTKSDMCFCNLLYVTDSNREEKSQLCFDDSNDKKQIMHKMFESHNANFAVWNKLIKRECIQNIRFDETIKIYEDALFVFTCLDKIEKVSFVKDDLYCYVVTREDSALHKFNIKSKITILEAMIKMDEILNQNDISERFFQQADFIGRVYLYENLAKKEKLKLDFNKYKEEARRYLKNGLLKQKIGFRNKLKIIIATHFTKQYVKIVSRKISN